MKEQIMNVRFLYDFTDSKRSSRAMIEYGGKTESIDKGALLDSLEKDIAEKNFIVGNQMTRDDVGDFIYYHFFYYDGQMSRKLQLQVPKTDTTSIQRVDRIRKKLEKIEEEPKLSGKLKVFGERAVAILAAGVILTTVTLAGTVLFVDAWEKESRAHDEYIQSQIPQALKDEWARQERENQIPQDEIVFEDSGRTLH